MDKPLSELIREFRKQTLTKEGKPMSLLDLSLEIGWSNPSTLSRIESGDVMPSRDTVIKIANALVLKLNNLNLLLRSAGYLEVSPDPTEDYTKNYVNSVKAGFEVLAFPVLLIGFNSTIVYWNRFTEVFFLGKDMVHEEIVKKYQNITHIDLLFNLENGVQQSIENWDELSKILVENIHFHISQVTEQTMNKSYIEAWMKYPEFKKHWIECEKTKSEQHRLYNLPFVYKHKELGIVKLTITTSVMYDDNRFFIEQFAPATKKDAVKMTKYWDMVNRYA